MDWADDVSYAVHDFEDYVRAGLIPFHAIQTDLLAFTEHCRRVLSTRLSAAGFDADKFENAIERIRNWRIEAPYGGSRDDEAKLNSWVSARITEYLGDETVSLSDDAVPLLHIDEDMQYEVEVLKQFPVFYVIESPPFAAAQRGQCRIVASLFDSLKRMAERQKSSVPRTLREILISVETEPSVAAERKHNKDFVAARAVVDYLCTLTESQAFELHERFRGASPSMFHGPWL